MQPHAIVTVTAFNVDACALVQCQSRRGVQHWPQQEIRLEAERILRRQVVRGDSVRRLGYFRVFQKAVLLVKGLKAPALEGGHLGGGAR